MSLLEKYTKSPEALRDFQAGRLAMEVTELICQIMQDPKVSQTELAARLGKPRSHVKEILEGETSLTIQTIADVFAALGRSLRVVDQPLSIGTPRLQVTVIPSQPDPVATDAPRTNTASGIAPELNSQLTKN